MKLTLFSLIILATLVLAVGPAASPPAQAQSEFRVAINDTVLDSQEVAGTWRSHLHPQLRIWSKATGSDSIKTKLYVQFKMGGVDTSARVLIDSIITQSGRYFVVNTGGASYRIISVGMVDRNAHVAPFANLKVTVDERAYGR